MSDDWRGDPKATSKKDLWRIFRLAKVTKDDIFCDLGCGHGNLCRYAIQKVISSIGTEEQKQRFRKARRNTKRFEKIKILNMNYRYEVTLRKLREGTIFYCTNELNLGFYRKFEKIMKPKTRLVSYYFPPYPIKPNSFDGWYYLTTTPFSIAKTKNEWIKSVTKKGTLQSLIRKIRRDLDEDWVFSLEEDFEGIEWIRTKR